MEFLAMLYTVLLVAICLMMAVLLFRSDPYDNQSGEMEADGVGLAGEERVTTKEVLRFEEVK